MTQWMELHHFLFTCIHLHSGGNSRYKGGVDAEHLWVEVNLSNLTSQHNFKLHTATQKAFMSSQNLLKAFSAHCQSFSVKISSQISYHFKFELQSFWWIIDPYNCTLKQERSRTQISPLELIKKSIPFTLCDQSWPSSFMGTFQVSWPCPVVALQGEKHLTNTGSLLKSPATLSHCHVDGPGVLA